MQFHTWHLTVFAFSPVELSFRGLSSGETFVLRLSLDDVGTATVARGLPSGSFQCVSHGGQNAGCSPNLGAAGRPREASWEQSNSLVVAAAAAADRRYVGFITTEAHGQIADLIVKIMCENADN